MSEPSERDREMAEQWWAGTFGEPVEPDEFSELWILVNQFAAVRAEGDQAGYERGRRGAASLFDAIAHGDEAHRAWLKQAIEDHFAGRPVQKPAGEGGYERGRREAIEECVRLIAVNWCRDPECERAIRAFAESTTWAAPERASLGRESK